MKYRYDHFHAQVQDLQTGKFIEVEGGLTAEFHDVLEQFPKPGGKERTNFLLAVVSDWAEPRMERITNEKQAERYKLICFQMAG